MGKKGSCRLVMTENTGEPHQRRSAKQNVRAVGLPVGKQADGQTGQILTGTNPANPGLPPTLRLHKRNEGSKEVDVCRRMLSVFRFTLAPWVSRRIRKLDGLALRAGKDFSRCRPTVFRTVSSPDWLW